jgi:uncharacterized protein YcnI
MKLSRAAAGLAASAAALVAAPLAWGHAEMSPDVVKAKETQLFTLAVPTEKANANTVKVELTPPAGFVIDSFVSAPGWKRAELSTGSGEEAVIQKVTWSGSSVPAEEDAIFQFLASTDADKTYEFKVRQFYSDGSVVDWSGPESSDTPAPVVEATSDLGGGGGGNSALELVALVIAGVALVLAVVALLSGRGGRSLT